MLHSSYDYDESVFGTVIHRQSERKKDRSPLPPKKIINFDLDFDCSTSTKSSKQDVSSAVGSTFPTNSRCHRTPKRLVPTVKALFQPTLEDATPPHMPDQHSKPAPPSRPRQSEPDQHISPKLHPERQRKKTGKQLPNLSGQTISGIFFMSIRNPSLRCQRVMLTKRCFIS